MADEPVFFCGGALKASLLPQTSRGLPPLEGVAENASAVGAGGRLSPLLNCNFNPVFFKRENAAFVIAVACGSWSAYKSSGNFCCFYDFYNFFIFLINCGLFFFLYTLPGLQAVKLRRKAESRLLACTSRTMRPKLKYCRFAL